MKAHVQPSQRLNDEAQYVWVAIKMELYHTNRTLYLYGWVRMHVIDNYY